MMCMCRVFPVNGASTAQESASWHPSHVTHTRARRDVIRHTLHPSQTHTRVSSPVGRSESQLVSPAVSRGGRPCLHSRVSFSLLSFSLAHPAAMHVRALSGSTHAKTRHVEGNPRFPFLTGRSRF